MLAGHYVWLENLISRDGVGSMDLEAITLALRMYLYFEGIRRQRKSVASKYTMLAYPAGEVSPSFFIVSYFTSGLPSF